MLRINVKRKRGIYFVKEGTNCGYLLYWKDKKEEGFVPDGEKGEKQESRRNMP